MQSRPRGIVAGHREPISPSAAANITDAAQFDDVEQWQLLRAHLSFTSEEGVGLEALRRGASPPSPRPFGSWSSTSTDGADKMKVVIMVSRFGHCLNDLL